MAYVTLQEQCDRDTILAGEAKYSHSRGKTIGGAVGRMRSDAKHRERMAKKSDIAEVEKALAARAKAQRQLESALRRLPDGHARQRAVTLCLAAGDSRSDIARAMGISRQRVGQLLDAHDTVPF